MALGNSRYDNVSPCFKSISVGTGGAGSSGKFSASDRHLDENMLGIPEYTIGSLPTLTGTNKNTLGVDLQIGSATLVVKNWLDGKWYRFNGTVI